MATLSSTNCFVVGEQSSDSFVSSSLSNVSIESRLLALQPGDRLGDLVTGVLVLKKGSDIGSSLATGVLHFSLEISLEKDVLRNFGRNLGDFDMKEASDMSRLLLFLLAGLKFCFVNCSSVASSTDERDEEHSLL